MTILTHIGARVLLIAGVLSLVVSLFFVRAEEPGITFATGGLNLKVDSEASYNGISVPTSTWELKNLVPGIDKFWNFSDIKPGDKGENTISLHTNKDAWVCLEFLNLEEDENGENEPEGLVDDSAPGEGELADHMEFFAWHDDGDNVFEIGEKPIFGTTTQQASQVLNNRVYTIADSKQGPAIPKNQTRYFGIYWCAGDLTVDLATAALLCNGNAMGNDSQTDSMSVDVQLFAVAKRDKPKFTCDKIVVPPPGEQCEVGSVTIKIDNTTTIISTTTSSSNTGGNTVGGGGTIITGNASSSSSSTNIVNTTIINSVRNLLRR